MLSLYTDEMLATVAAKVTSAEELPPRALDAALISGGPLTRIALAPLVPTRCLIDASGAVRAAALRSLANKETVTVTAELALKVRGAALPLWRCLHPCMFRYV